jgi:hypothetical protein
MSSLFEVPNIDRRRNQDREISVAINTQELQRRRHFQNQYMTFRIEANFDDSKCILGASYVQQDIHLRD